MRNLLCFLLMIGFGASVSAQKVYFIYLQTENGSPFYIKMGDEIISSSSAGYLILPNMVDSTYQLSVGYPSSNTEAKFRITPNGRDKGFLLKNFDFGIGLYDLQSSGILKPLIEETEKKGSYRMKNDDFTLLLSKAARDTSLLWVPVFTNNDVAITEPPKPEEIQPKKIEEQNTIKVIDSIETGQVFKTEDGIKKDSVQNISLRDETGKDSLIAKNDAVKLNEEDKNAQKEESRKETMKDDKLIQKDTVAIAPPLEITEKKSEPSEFKRSAIKKYSESSTSEGFGLVYFDHTENGIDTIRLLIPNPPVMLKQEETVKKGDKQFLDINNIPADNKKDNTVDAKEDKNVVPKNNCPGVASDADFHKLRRNMAGEETDEDMVAVAKKYFRNKCFSTEQVKNLSVLFLTSAGKYLFFDAAYFHVTDRENFPVLGEEIKDNYYQKRFKALIGE